MSAGWEVGDLALCVGDHDNWFLDDGGDGDFALSTDPDPKLGEILRVIWVGNCDSVLRLSFAKYPDRYEAVSFRKIRPDEHESCEAEFITLLKRSKAPKQVSA